MNAVESRLVSVEKEEEGHQHLHHRTARLEEEAELFRRFALGSLCLASVCLLTAVLLLPLIFSSARTVQSAVAEQSSECLSKLALIYGQMDRIGPAVDAASGRARPARHVPTNSRNKLRQAIKNQRKTRYLQQKLAETAALLNSQEVWEDGIGTGREEEGRKKSKDDARHIGGEEPGNSAEIGGSLAGDGLKAAADVFGSSSSFEISSEQHWHNQQKGAAFHFSTSFPFPARVSPRLHSKEVKESKAPVPFSTIAPSVPTSRERQLSTEASTAPPLQPRQTKSEEQEDGEREEEEKQEGGCCSCAVGPPGPPGFAGADGLPGQDGRPGQNGLNGRDAPEDHRPAVEDFCFQCPRAPVGEPGPAGPKGPPGKAGRPGENGERGRRGQPGRRGATGGRGEPGKAGLPGEEGQPGKVVKVPGPEGPEGAQGKPGRPGLPGPPGQPGCSEDGRPGPIGKRGIDGRKGAVGMPGKAGTPGKQGPPGGCAHCNMPRTAPGY